MISLASYAAVAIVAGGAGFITGFLKGEGEVDRLSDRIEFLTGENAEFIRQARENGRRISNLVLVNQRLERLIAAHEDEGRDEPPFLEG